MTLSAVMWLTFESTDGDRFHVAKLSALCTRFKSQVEGNENLLLLKA